MIARYPNHKISGTEEQYEIKNYKTSSVVIVTNKVMVEQKNANIKKGIERKMSKQSNEFQ